MKVKCRGYEGELTYLDICETKMCIRCEPVNLYSIRIQVSKSVEVGLAGVIDSEIEVCNDGNGKQNN